MKLNSAFGHQCPYCKRKIPPPSPPAWKCKDCEVPVCVWCYHVHTIEHDPKAIFIAPSGEPMVSEVISVDPSKSFTVHIGDIGEDTTIKESG